MECFVIPGILVGVWLVMALVLRWRVYKSDPVWDDNDGFRIPTVVVGGIFLIISLVLPIIYHTDSRSIAIKATNYYDNIITPAIIEEHDDYVVISNVETGIWQAGTLTEYNSYLASNRYWDDVPILGYQVYPAPERLKFVQIQEDN